MEIPIIPLMLAVLGIVVGIAYILTQIENRIDRNKLEKNLENYEQKERKKQSQTGTSK
tara:strand:+ start:425 stop:598 length:174 start_codon:yes stop_codon:yes gene_type:complete